MSSQQYRRRHSSVHPFPLPMRHGHVHGHSAHHGKYADMPTVSRSVATRRFSDEGRGKDSLKCQSCGKVYKHISSLAKHLWEHTPEWTMTKKLLISKHQQVQLLEAASILVGMNEPGSSVDEGDHVISQSPFSRSLPRHSEKDDDSLRMPGEQIPSSYSPMPGCVGGYIDVPSKKQYTRMESPDEEQEYKRDVVDEDEEILGKMD